MNKMGRSFDLSLNNGHRMPLVGFGTWQAANKEEIAQAVDAALHAGYRHIDTASIYGSEEIIGKVLKTWFESGKIRREEVFIVTKLPPSGMRPEHVSHFLKLSLKNLQLDYIDLYLVHSPIGFKYDGDMNLFPVIDGKPDLDMGTDLEAIWKAMEEQVDNGLAKSIGVSNFSVSQIERIVKVSRIKPANIQVELHAYFQQKELVDACRKHGISVCAYAPIGSPGRQVYCGKSYSAPPLFVDPVVVEIAKKHGKTEAQILLRFLTQKGIIVIPKSVNAERIKQNIALNFDLSDSELKALEGLDKGKEGRTFNPGVIPEMKAHPEYSE